MASVPNTKVFTALPVPGAQPAAEGEGAEIFASLLPTLVAPGAPAPDGTVPGAMPVPELPVVDVRPAGKAATGKVVDDFDPQSPEGEGGDGDADDAEDVDPLATLLAQANFVPAVQVPAAAAKPTPAPARGPAVALPAPSLPLPVQADAPAPAPAAKASPAASVVSETVRLAAASVSDTQAAPPKSPAKAVARTPAAPRQADAPVPTAPVAEPEVPAKPAPVAKEPAVPATPVTATSGIATTLPFAPADPAAVTAAPSARAEAPQPAPAADQAITRELDLAHDSEWLDRLARDIARTQDGDTPLRFKLHPQTLGHLKVEVSQTDQGATVRLTVETEAARALLADAQPRLAAEARAQGVRLANTEVDLGNAGQQASGDPRRQEDGRQPAFIRTARGASAEAIAPAETARARSDRYA